MRCPYCSNGDTRVVDSRPAEGGTAVRRRRECERCGVRFTTFERSTAPLTVRKRSGRVEAFDAAKLRGGIERAVADRPVRLRDIDELVASIAEAAQSGGGEISSDEIGRMVLQGLRAIDEAAYLRFASVYKDFSDVEDFEREVAALEEQP